MQSDDSYIRALQADKDIADHYYQKWLSEKPEQVKFLEKIIAKENLSPANIADICCGSGALAVHLGRMFPGARLDLVDLNPEAIELARKNVKQLDAKCLVGSIYDLPLAEASYDLVICWQSLLDLEKPKDALLALLRLCRPSGLLIVCSLFNFDSDVDVYANVVDHTRSSSRAGLALNYNTISLFSIRKWIEGVASRLDSYPFHIEIDLPKKGRGLGTFTQRTDEGGRLQISAGMLMNWGILLIRK